MTDRIDSSDGNDVLGISTSKIFVAKGFAVFTPWPICAFMARSTCDAVPEERKDAFAIMDPTCGSGRMLLASAKVCALIKNITAWILMKHA